jgi:PA14 domain
MEATRVCGDGGEVLLSARWRQPSPVFPVSAPDRVRDDPAMEFDWYSGSTAPQITPDRFMARLTRTDVLSAGVFRFSGSADDGIRVYVDNNPIVDLRQR